MNESVEDQATSGLFRIELGVQLIAAGLFGLVPLLVPDAFAKAVGLTGDDPYLIRLAGAATLGYAAAALVGLRRGTWQSLRIPIATTLVFNLAAWAAAFVSIDESGVFVLAAVVGLAAPIFAAVAAYWLYLDQGPRPAGPALEAGFRWTLVLATIAATLVGLWQWLLPHGFARVFDLPQTDPIIIRLAGAATLGFGVGGALSAMANQWPAIRTQTIAAITANVAAALASILYIVQGGTSLLGPLFLVASVGLVVGLGFWSLRAER